MCGEQISRGSASTDRDHAICKHRDQAKRWTYIFAPRTGRASVVRAVIAPLWSTYEPRALGHAASEAERFASR
jgi:hypothetical protein